MKVHIALTGGTELKAQFRRLKGASPQIMTEFVENMTIVTHGKAVRGIQRGPASGFAYEKSNPDRTHIASAPGEYPMSDTGRLASSIKMELPALSATPEGVVGTNVMYGKWLEFKLPYQGGRPWLGRAFTEATKGGTRRLKRIFDKYAKKAT